MKEMRMDDEMEPEDMVKGFTEFINTHYKKELESNIADGRHYLEIDFKRLKRFNRRLAEELIEYPEEVSKAAEIATYQIGKAKEQFRVRVVGLPKDIEVRIHDLRSEHTGKLIVIRGVVINQSAVFQVVVSARFVCTGCGRETTILQFGGVLRGPRRCSCGRKAGFTIFRREMVDVQSLVLEEAPEDLKKGEKPRLIEVLLGSDLTSPSRERQTLRGRKVKVAGIVLAKPEKRRSTKHYLLLEANNVYPV